MRIRAAQEPDAAAMAHVLIASTRCAFRDFIPHASLYAFTPEESERNWVRALRQVNARPPARSASMWRRPRRAPWWA
jgi:hypothetical protein